MGEWMSAPPADLTRGSSTDSPSPGSSCASCAALSSRDRAFLADLIPDAATRGEKLIRVMAAVGHPICITSGRRTAAQQAELFAQGRTKPGAIVTNADGIKTPSNHQSGRAFDVAFLQDGKPSWAESHPWLLLGTVGEALGLSWGGRWTAPNRPDRPHFQWKPPAPATMRSLLGMPTTPTQERETC